MSSPEVLKTLTEKLYVIPSLVGSNLPDELSGFQITEEPLKANYYGGATSKEFNDFFVRASQLYLADKVSLDEFTKNLNKEFKRVKSRHFISLVGGNSISPKRSTLSLRKDKKFS